MPDKPAWLNEQPEIFAVLNQFLDKLDSKPFEQWTHPPAITINEKILPGLFTQGEQADQTWSLIKSLAQDYHLIEIRLDKKRDPYDPEYFRARLRLEKNTEEILRQWLQRPRQKSYLQQWREEVNAVKAQFPGDVEKLWFKPVALQDKTARQIVQAFAKINDYQTQELTLRQLSAVVFWGRSKFLDGRQDLLKSLYPEIRLTLRPVVVNIYLPNEFEGVLFIENQDSYTSAMQGKPPAASKLALVYSAGFKSSAKRIRERGGVLLHFTGEGSETHKVEFDRWWHNKSDQHWPLWFWGDLDYAGMNILKQLIRRFPQMQSWQPGYKTMLENLITGNGYSAGQSEQQTQVDPQLTGCSYADEVLLPAIRKYSAFVDQEMIY